MISHPRLLAELTHKLLSPSQVMTGYSREQVMHSLELQTAVNPIQPCWTLDIHRRTHLTLREGLCGSEITCRHTPVAQRDLNVQDHRDKMADQDEADADGPRG